MAFQVGDACALPFGDASFDHTLSMLVLQFIPQADKAVREMRRVTRPGGIVAAATWDTGGGLVAHRMIFDTAALIDRDGSAARAQAYGRPLSRRDELTRLWQAAGLVDVVQDMRTIRMDFACFADFWTPVEGNEGPVAAYVRNLDAETAARLRLTVEIGLSRGRRRWATVLCSDGLGRERQSHVKGKIGVGVSGEAVAHFCN